MGGFVYIRCFGPLSKGAFKVREISSLIGIAFLAIMLYLFILLIVSLAELIEVKDNRLKESHALPKGAVKKAQKCKLDDILAFIEKNENAELQIIWQGKLFFAGASSSSEPNDNDMYDKEYYIGNRTFRSIDEFKSEMELFSFDDFLTVYKIDDLPCCEINLENEINKSKKGNHKG